MDPCLKCAYSSIVTASHDATSREVTSGSSIGGVWGGGAHHPSDAAVSDADPDLGLLRAPLGVGHTHDVRGVGGLHVAHRPRHGHVDLADAGAERRGEVGGIGQYRASLF